ncbi:MAG: phospholipase D family protein [Verrucomicrobia bacterium]|nr:phospholipase D family protein [Verrucomicrobiota bacterium]
MHPAPPNRPNAWVLALLLVGFATRAWAAPLEGSAFAAAAARSLTAADDPAVGNQLLAIGNGYDALLLRVHLIRHARTSVAIQTFIWTNDECGRLLIYELLEAARRGVKVRILADHLVSEQDPATIAFLATAHPNLEIKHYRPPQRRLKPSLWRQMLTGLFAFRDFNQRMHNKVMLVDEAVLVTGGRNVENTYFDHSTELNFRDRDVLAVGPVVRAAVDSFEQFWKFRHAVSSRALVDVEAAVQAGKFRRYETRADYDFGPHFTELDREAGDGALVTARFVARLRPVRRASFICDEPGKTDSDGAGLPRITRALRGALEQARESVVMQTPYLVLSKPAQELFKEMKRRSPGLRVRVSTNSFASTDNLFAYSANYRLRNNYIEDLQLEVHEFQPRPASLLALFPRQPVLAALAAQQAKPGKTSRAPFLCVHAKSLVIDGRVAFVGSYNLDPRSERLNTEVGLLVEDEAFARELQAEIEADMLPKNSWVIARRSRPLGLDTVNGLIGDLLSLGPLDVWPIQNTSSFELRPGAPAVPPGHPDFFRNHRDVGSFPGTDGLLSTKEILTRLYKAVGTPLTPIL